ncbi:F-box protein At3g22700-like [Aegilops tauschii subsp. strangulata]|uniref:F-box protein At3g22700-like n=1 Tax=Aegilops tauschii subsp. strangulata TaxID=200361 RepID=UPI003CC83F58
MDPKRVCKSRRAELALELPEDVVEEILLRLPAKSVGRFLAVCKSWHGLLSDHAFQRAHHGRAPHAVLLRRRARAPGSDWDYAIYTLPLGQPAATALRLGEAQQRVVLHGCCHGLLLLSRSDHRPNSTNTKYLAYNPTTGQHAPVPGGFDYGHHVAGFYFHAATAEHRVLFYRWHRTDLVRRRPPRQRETVTRKHYAYSVAAAGRPGVRALPSTSYGGYTRWKLNDAPVMLRGCLHWMRRFPRVIVFDTESEKFRGMHGPAEDGRMIGRLVGMDGTLGASAFAEGSRTVRVWVLQDYRKETWVVKHTVDVRFMGGGFDFKWLGIAHVTQEGDALFYGARRYGVYNLTGRKVVSAGKEIGFSLTATWHVYREGLVSPAPKGRLEDEAVLRDNVGVGNKFEDDAVLHDNVRVGNKFASIGRLVGLLLLRHKSLRLYGDANCTVSTVRRISFTLLQETNP